MTSTHTSTIAQAFAHANITAGMFPANQPKAELSGAAKSIAAALMASVDEARSTVKPIHEFERGDILRFDDKNAPVYYIITSVAGTKLWARWTGTGAGRGEKECGTIAGEAVVFAAAGGRVTVAKLAATRAQVQALKARLGKAEKAAA